MRKVKVSEFAEVITGGTPSTSVPEYWDNGTIPWLQSGSCQNCMITECNTFITQAGLDNSAAKMMKPDSVLIALTGATTGKVGYLTFEACANQSVTGIQPNDQFVPKYLYYYLLGIRQKILDDSYGGAQKHISQGYVKNLEIPLCTIDEQRRIVSIFERVDRIISDRQQELIKLDELIKARFVEMFGDPEINPKGWDKAPLKDHAEVLVGYPFPSEGYSEEGVDIVGGYNLMQGYIQWNNSKHWPNETGYEQFLLQENDIVMAMDRPWVNGGFKIARVNANHLPALLIQRTACIRGKGILQEFLHMLLDSQRFAEHCNITGSLVPHISNKDINSFQVILPPIELQNEFASFVAQVDKSKVV